MIEKCIELRETCVQDPFFQEVTPLHTSKDLIPLFYARADVKNFKEVTSGIYEEEISFECTRDKVEAKITSDFSDDYTGSDEHKLAKIERAAEKLNKKIFDHDVQEEYDEEYDDKEYYFQINGETTLNFPLDAPNGDILNKTKQKLNDMRRELSDKVFK